MLWGASMKVIYSNLSRCIQLVRAGIPSEIGLTSDPHIVLFIILGAA
jgi:hypothetical protein